MGWLANEMVDSSKNTETKIVIMALLGRTVVKIVSFLNHGDFQDGM